MMNNNSDLLQHRYCRQIAFEPFGLDGQEQLSLASVLICGCGALGGSVAQLLVRAGIGHLRLVDPDTVSMNNLHRQFLFTEDDATQKRNKVEAAAQILKRGNSTITIETFTGRFHRQNAELLVQNIDLLIDGTDNFPTRFLLNEIALQYNIPFVSGGVTGAKGQVMTVIPGKTPCLSCLISQQPEHEQVPFFPVFGPIVQVISAFQAMEAIKILSGNLDRINPALTIVDLWQNRVQSVSLENLPPCQCRIGV